MNIYDRIINILLEARVEMFIQDRLDEKKLTGKQKKLDVNKSGKLDAEDFKMLRSGKRADEAKEEKGMSPEVKGAIRQDRFEKATGISPARSEDVRQAVHKARRGNPKTKVMDRAAKRLVKDETKMGAHKKLGPNRTANVKGRVKKSMEKLKSSPKPQLP